MHAEECSRCIKRGSVKYQSRVRNSHCLLSYDIPKNEADCKQKIREEFKRNAHVSDIRIIDKLIIRGQMELQEVANVWKTKGGLMHYWKESWEKKPTDFMSKFLSGQD
ncbi:PREDICTED: NADH dehydrogenase [ubiquinone] 1 alpha subcomplex subunit 6 isoform X2 [Wasmannia auropunctata]|uniref:NADH dehydrogenase [ubiquinone] 1 alpha subcomplex subunit 6 isoform X2 n=1 Tax=Wasmannia auropunctata TaxID=64793 RepID=UPI0005EF9F0B|nr:PREDICTED: NADH dehydrogenase [ubiquinone] 1 alpha subcomplex subunit 6 isoform X2 [Wasmannia auropunctata]